MLCYCYSPISAERAEVRLLVIEPGDRDANLECRIQHSVLTENPPFEALSYTWGDGNDWRPITLNGSSWRVTADLESALRCLRQQNRPRAMWIDAICLNQKDLKEKAEQVPKMWDIYRSATKVVVWLGPAGDDGHAAIEAIQDIVNKLDAVDVDLMEMRQEDLLQAGIDITQINWPSIWSLFNRPYWRRVWVIQELASCASERGACPDENDKGIIFCGSKSIPKGEFDMFALVLIILRRSRRFCFSGNGIFQEPIRGLATVEHPALRMYMAYLAGYTLAITLRHGSCFQASVPHDMLYALLGQMSVDESALIIPDYSKPIESVYIDAYKSLILHSRSLSIILFNRICHDGQGPSWIYGLTPRIPSGFLWVDEENDTKPFKATADVPMDIYFENECRRLVTKGIKAGVLDIVIGPNSLILPHHSEMQPDEPGLRTQGLDSSLPKFLEELKAFRQMMSSDDDHEGFWKTLVMDFDSSDLGNEKAPAPQHFEDEFEVAFGRKEIPLDNEPDLPPDERKARSLGLINPLR